MSDKLTLRKKLALELFRKYRKNTKSIHELDYLFWECTLRCNLNCLHCGSDCSKDALVKDMPVKDFIKAIDDIKTMVDPNKTMVVFTGGEPLMRKDLEEAGQELYNRGFPWGFVSNGMLLSPKRLQSLLKAGLRAVTISLDGMEDSHNWLRNHPQSFKKAVEAIRILAQVEDLRFDVVTCANKKSFTELDEIKNLLINTGVKEWRIFTITPIGRADEADELQLDNQQFRQLFDYIARIRKEKKISLNYGCEGFLGNYEGEVRDNLFFCRAGITVGSILVDGSISACPNLRSNFIQGNIYKDSFTDVWQNKYQIFRDRSWAKQGICANCKYFKYCEGNGLHLHNEDSDEPLFCHLHRMGVNVK
ncbi:MAG: TIGR04133 family radical SAM/SPASM protein [Bacteroidota bacterium]|nr:TIGR04133 family radical SAM/SPASM protein [Bacteroidota bacterium]